MNSETNPESSGPGKEIPDPYVNLYLEKYGKPGPDLLCPELNVYNTFYLKDYWSYLRRKHSSTATMPYWAYVWPGGRALARYILDNPEKFRDQRVLDVGCGSGIIALGAAKAGAEVTGLDVDARALALARRTAGENGLSNRIGFREADIGALKWQELESFHWILAGDPFYEEGFARTLTTLARKLVARGVSNLLADPLRVFAPRRDLEIIVERRTPVYREIDGVRTRDVRILSVF